MSAVAEFPIPLDQYKALPLDPRNPKLTAEQRDTLKKNIEICRDAIVFFTAIADAKGLGGHTGGPFDTVPEVCIMHSFMKFRRSGRKTFCAADLLRRSRPSRGDPISDGGT